MRALPLLALFACGGRTPPATSTNASPPAIASTGLQTRLDATDSGELLFTVLNPTDGPRTFCTYHTPFEGLRNDILVVRSAGQRVPYAGVLAKRMPPGPDDYRTLGPGEDASVSFPLADGYTLEPGSYNVLFAGNEVSGLPASPAVIVSLP